MKNAASYLLSIYFTALILFIISVCVIWFVKHIMMKKRAKIIAKKTVYPFPRSTAWTKKLPIATTPIPSLQPLTRKSNTTYSLTTETDSEVLDENDTQQTPLFRQSSTITKNGHTKDQKSLKESKMKLRMHKSTPIKVSSVTATKFFQDPIKPARQSTKPVTDYYCFSNKKNYFFSINKHLASYLKIALSELELAKLNNFLLRAKIIFGTCVAQSGFIINDEAGTIKLKLCDRDWRLYGKRVSEHVYEIGGFRQSHKDKQIIWFNKNSDKTQTNDQTSILTSPRLS